jgi:hypothetical protein
MSFGRNEYRDSSNYDVQGIPVEQVQPGFSLVIDRGEGPQLFQVEDVAFSSQRQDDGSYVNTFTLTSGPVAGGGAPWVITLPMGTLVGRILRRTA